MTTSARIRQAELADAYALVAFNQAMARETEGRELRTDVLSPGVNKVLTEPMRGFYLVAESTPSSSNSEVVGSLMVTYEWSDWRNGNFWWVQSVYVDPTWRRQGVYRALYDEVCRLAQLAGDVCGVRLYVERDNHIAQQTYSVLGMEETAYRLFEVEFDR